jgi:hypothetical protein
MDVSLPEQTADTDHNDGCNIDPDFRHEEA